MSSFALQMTKQQPPVRCEISVKSEEVQSPFNRRTTLLNKVSCNITFYPFFRVETERYHKKLNRLHGLEERVSLKLSHWLIILVSHLTRSLFSVSLSCTFVHIDSQARFTHFPPQPFGSYLENFRLSLGLLSPLFFIFQRARIDIWRPPINGPPSNRNNSESVSCSWPDASKFYDYWPFFAASNLHIRGSSSEYTSNKHICRRQNQLGMPKAKWNISVDSNQIWNCV